MKRTTSLMLALMTGPLHAATFVVDTTSDANLPACSVAVADDCSLRGAITAANALAGAHRIEFAIPPTDAGYQAATQHWRIAPATALPSLEREIVIDGFTQPGATPNTNPVGFPIGHVIKIELRGQSNLLGLTALPSARLTVRGLALNGWQRAIFLFAPGPHRVVGNYIGTAVDGITAVPNTGGIAPAGDTTIGGNTGADANVIAANRDGGIVMQQQVTRLRVQGNFIGVGADGATVPGRQYYGLQLVGAFADTLIGGDAQTERNVISGNEYSAIYASGQGVAAPNAPHARIEGNYFGVSAVGTTPVGNGINPSSPSQPQPTILVFRADTCGVSITRNLIAHGGAAGVQIGTCREAPVLDNVFLDNRGLPIDLSAGSNADGHTADDADDVDAFGGNRLQNRPEVISLLAVPANDELRLTLRVDTAPANATYPLRIDIYRDDAMGLLPVANETYTLADAQQPREFVLPLSLVGERIAVQATDAAGNSSELRFAGPLFGDGFEGD